MISISGGPYLAIAVLCEKVLDEKDGVLSAIRIIDRMVFSGHGADAPLEMPPIPVNIKALISFKSGQAKGEYVVKIKSNDPEKLEVSMPIKLEGDERGANVIVNLGFTAKKEGLFWFDVFLSDQLITRIPLRLIYQRVTPGLEKKTH